MAVSPKIGEGQFIAVAISFTPLRLAVSPKGVKGHMGKEQLATVTEAK
jgi:hypothetical protein